MLLVAVLAASLACAAAARRHPYVRQRLSVAATTILATLAGAGVGLTLMVVVDGPWRSWLTLGATLLAAVVAIAVGAWVRERLAARLRRRRAAASGGGVLDHVDRWVERHPVHVGSVDVLGLAVRSWHRASDVRVTGLAAEMSYYALISLVPLATALGASLGFLEPVLGPRRVERIQSTLVDAVAAVFAEQVTDDVLAPLVEGLLQEERAGVALGGVLVALWLASRMFRAAIRALDDAYKVPERRGLVGRLVLGLALALGAVVTLVALLAMVVVGPLLGDGQEIAARFGLGGAFEVSWAVLRWPALAVVCGAYLGVLYRYAPNVRTTWTRCLPGAAFGTVALVGVAAGFGAYLRLAGPAVPTAGPSGLTVTGQAAAVDAAAQTLGLVLAGVLWLWLSSIVVLAGGVLNAELDQGRSGAREPAGAEA